MEIEIRAFIDSINGMKKKLSKLGARFESEQHIIDYWYCPRNCTRFEHVQMDKPGSYGLRIRRSEGSKVVNELNCKVLNAQGDHNAFHEHETRIESLDEGQKILEAIGFKVFCVVDKKRTAYSLDNCSINVEDIKGFRPAVELEIISESESEAHKQFLRGILDKLGIQEKERIEKSITFLYMKEFSFKNQPKP